MDKINSPITTIPGISLRMGAMIIAEIGDFNNFDSPDKILAFAGLSPSTYQSGQLNNCYAHIEKRGSRYLRYALFNATKFVCNWDPLFAEYFAKKRSEGKTTMLLFLMLPRSWYALFLLCKSPDILTYLNPNFNKF